MQEIYDKLAPVRSRQKLIRMIGYVGIGMIAGGLAAVVFALASILLMPALQLAGWSVLACGPILALVISQLSPPTWAAAAHAVDEHFQLDDRVLSAVTFLEQGKLSGLHALQINDTAARLAQIDAAAVVQLRLPKPIGIGAGWVLVAAAMLLFLPQYEPNPVAETGDSSTQTPESTTGTHEAAVPLPKGISWKPAINSQSVFSLEDAGDSQIDAFKGQATTTAALLNTRTDLRYRRNSSHDKQAQK